MEDRERGVLKKTLTSEGLLDLRVCLNCLSKRQDKLVKKA